MIFSIYNSRSKAFNSSNKFYPYIGFKDSFKNKSMSGPAGQAAIAMAKSLSKDPKAKRCHLL